MRACVRSSVAIQIMLALLSCYFFSNTSKLKCRKYMLNQNKILNLVMSITTITTLELFCLSELQSNFTIDVSDHEHSFLHYDQPPFSRMHQFPRLMNVQIASFHIKQFRSMMIEY